MKKNLRNNKAIFLDRDGTLNDDVGYVYRIQDLRILDGVKEGLNGLKILGYKLIIISNQSGIGRGYYCIEDCDKFNNELEQQLGLKFDGIYICPHSPEENCECRKPKAFLVKKAVQDFDLNINQCFFVGDKKSDIQTGINAGCKTVLIQNTQYENTITSDLIVSSLLQFSEMLKKYLIMN